MQHCREEYGLNWDNWILIPVYLQCLFFVKVFFLIYAPSYDFLLILCAKDNYKFRGTVLFCCSFGEKNFFSYWYNLLQLKYAQWYLNTLKKCSETVCTSNKKWVVALCNFPKCPWMKLCCTRRNIKINKLFVRFAASIYINKTLFLHVCFHWDPETRKSFCGDTILYSFKNYILDLYSRT